MPAISTVVGSSHALPSLANLCATCLSLFSIFIYPALLTGLLVALNGPLNCSATDGMRNFIASDVHFPRGMMMSVIEGLVLICAAKIVTGRFRMTMYSVPIAASFDPSDARCTAGSAPLGVDVAECTAGIGEPDAFGSDGKLPD